MSDRLTRLALLALAVAYGVTASRFQAMIGDPLVPVALGFRPARERWGVGMEGSD